MKTRFLIILAIGMIGFTGIAFAEHDPNQPYVHSIILPDDMKEKTFDEFMEWCEPYYEERCTDMYEKNKTSKLPIPLKLNDLASELWYDHDYIIDGTILDIRGYDQPERVYDIRINSFFKPEEGAGSKILTVYGSPNFYNSKGDSGIFFIKKDDARWTFGEYGAKATPECPPELMYHLPLEPQVYTRVPASGIDFANVFDCYPHYYKKYLPQYMKSRGVTEFPSPLSQQIDGVPPNQVVCNEGLELIIKNNGRAACVTPETVQKLIERNWIKPDEDGITVSFSFCGADGFDSEGNLNKNNSTHHWDENECNWEYVGPATNSINKWFGDVPENDKWCDTELIVKTKEKIDQELLKLILLDEIAKFGKAYDMPDRDILLTDMGENKSKISIEGS